MILAYVVAFAAAWWLGLYLIARGPRKALLMRAGGGLLAYAFAIACGALADALLDGWRIDHVARTVGTGLGAGRGLLHQNFHQGLPPAAGALAAARCSASLRSARAMPSRDMRRSSSPSDSFR